MNIDLKKLTKAQAAALLTISTRQVDNLVASGDITKHGQGKTAHYVWSEIFDGYISHKLAELAPASSKQDSENYNQADLRRLNAEARLKELKADEMEGKLVDVAYVERAVAQMNANVRGRLLALPAKLTPQLVGVSSTAKVKTLLDRETKQVCSELVKIAAKSPKVSNDADED